MGMTAAGSDAIRAKTVIGTNVKDATGDKIGQIEDIVLDKLSNNIVFAIVGFGGFLGMGEKYHPIPWSSLKYDEREGGYVVTASICGRRTVIGCGKASLIPDAPRRWAHRACGFSVQAARSRATRYRHAGRIRPTIECAAVASGTASAQGGARSPNTPLNPSHWPRRTQPSPLP